MLSFGGVLFVAAGTDGSLSIYTEESFGRWVDRLAQASPTQRQVRDYVRLFYARAQQVEVDRQGRIRVPTELAELTGLGKEAMLLECKTTWNFGPRNVGRPIYRRNNNTTTKLRRPLSADTRSKAIEIRRVVFLFVRHA